MKVNAMMMYTKRSEALLHFLHQNYNYDDPFNVKIFIFIQAFDYRTKQYFDLYIIRQNPDGSLYCLVDAYEDRDYLLLQSFSPDCLDGVFMWFKVYKKNQCPTLFEKGDQLYRMKNHIK
jgi:hypothetical protein